MSTIVVTGAASGIGLAFVESYLRSPGNLVIAVDKCLSGTRPSSDTTRLFEWDPESAIYPFPAPGSQLATCGIDLVDETQVDRWPKRYYFADFADDIDLVIHSAGVRGLVPSIKVADGSDIAGAESMNAMTASTMQDTLTVNTIGTFLFIRAVLPKVRPGGDAKVIIMGSRMGSTGHNTTGGGYAYRASKAAQNAIVKSFSIDVPEVTFVLMHPGRVESNLVGNGVKEEGAVTAEESVRDMRKSIEGLIRADSGRFMDRWGVDIPW